MPAMMEMIMILIILKKMIMIKILKNSKKFQPMNLLKYSLFLLIFANNFIKANNKNKINR